MKWDKSSQANAQAYVEKAAENAPQYEASSKKAFGERMKEWRQQLTQRGDDILANLWGQGQEFASFLSVLSRFNLSQPEGTVGEGVTNGALIYDQMPTAKCLKTFDQWADLGARIKKGSHSINLLVRRDKVENARRTTYYNAAKVFDVAQTTFQYHDTQPMLDELDVLRSISNSRLFDILVREDLPDGLEAAYIPKINEVWVLDGLNTQETRVALLRETAHYFLSKDAPSYVRSPEANFEAYTSAYLISQYFGLDTSKELMPFPEEAFPPLEKATDIRGLVASALDVSQRMCETMERTLEKLGTQLYRQNEEIDR